MPPVSWWSWIAASAAVIALLHVVLIALLVVAGRRADPRAVARFVPDCVVLYRRLLGDERVPRRARLLVGALVGYLAMPIDLVPDFIPVVGLLDDAIAVVLVVRMVVRASGPDVVREHWPGPDASLDALMRLSGGGRMFDRP